MAVGVELQSEGEKTQNQKIHSLSGLLFAVIYTLAAVSLHISRLWKINCADMMFCASRGPQSKL